jgi:cyclopropane-fatty-acyl-phospholipid synthase
MKSSSLSSAKNSVRAGSGIGASLLRRAVLRQLSQLRHGHLRLIDGDDYLEFGDADASLRAEIRVLDGALWGLVAGNGSIGAGEAYIHGYWSSPDLTAVIRVFVSNLDLLDAMERGQAQLGRPLIQSLHWLNRNTRKGSRQNIAAHYDLGNELFEQLLDPTMMYSAAMFASPQDSLELSVPTSRSLRLPNIFFLRFVHDLFPVFHNNQRRCP